MINKIWGFFITIGIIYCLLTNNLNFLNHEIMNSAKDSFAMIVDMFPVIALWLGIMNIANKAGLLKKMSKIFAPVLRFLFPEIPGNHESLDYISSNIAANMLGLGNAATPFGLKAMKSLQSLNIKKDTASRSMITFLIINTAGVTIIPTTVISLRMHHGSINPTEIIGATLITTMISLIFGVLIDRLVWRKKYDI